MSVRVCVSVCVCACVRACAMFSCFVLSLSHAYHYHFSINIFCRIACMLYEAV